MKLIIDRIEHETAIVELEDGTLAEIPVKILPPGTGEGDCLTIIIDQEETKKRKKEIKTLMDDLFQ